MNTELRKDCPMRHPCGNCIPAGGFCTAVNTTICEALHNAYDEGWYNAARRAKQEMVESAQKISEYWEDIMTESLAIANAIRDQQEAMQNEPLTLDELRQMDGEPVWIVESPDWGHWELSSEAVDYLEGREADFYGMMYDDPDGRYGLHKLGWLAYRHEPKEATHNA